MEILLRCVCHSHDAVGDPRSLTLSGLWSLASYKYMSPASDIFSKLDIFLSLSKTAKLSPAQ